MEMIIDLCLRIYYNIRISYKIHSYNLLFNFKNRHKRNAQLNSGVEKHKNINV